MVPGGVIIEYGAGGFLGGEGFFLGGGVPFFFFLMNLLVRVKLG